MAKHPAVVVFDVNIYVDIACLITQPFTWAKFDDVASHVMDDPVPHNENAGYDSIRAVAMSRSGQVGTGEALEVWTSDHIDRLTINKVQTAITDASGEAWTEANAIDFHDECVNTLVFDLTHGGSIGRAIGELNVPPLDYEDGMVMRTTVSAGEVVESPRYCITRDGPFRDAFLADRLEPTVQVLYPSEWVESLKKARRPDLRRLLGGRG